MIRRVFVSDIHMNRGNVWLDSGQAEQFAKFLGYVADRANDIDQLILVGDIMDQWVWPCNDRPPSYSDIADANPYIMEKLRTLAQTKCVTYVIGNHDITITKDSIDNFGNEACPEIVFQLNYEQDGIHAEHGHRFNMYNAYDDANKLPLGHYISRLYAGKKDKERWQDKIADEVKNTAAGIHNPLVNAPLTCLALIMNIRETDPIEMVGCGTTTLSEIRQWYEDLPGRWEESHGPAGPIESVIQVGTNRLDAEAASLAKESKKGS